jgi:hypothetical protein
MRTTGLPTRGPLPVTGAFAPPLRHPHGLPERLECRDPRLLEVSSATRRYRAADVLVSSRRAFNPPCKEGYARRVSALLRRSSRNSGLVHQVRQP